MDLIIDNEFRDFLPPLTDNEYKQLEENLLRDGILNPLVVWKGQNVLVDGHARYEIARKHNLPFETTELDFDDRDDVMLWMFQNQCARHNLTTKEIAQMKTKTTAVVDGD